MLEIDIVCARVGAFTLSDIHLAIPPGQCHAVLGPSGSGKSTLLNVVRGTLPVLAGRIRLANQDITDLPPSKRRLGDLPQAFGGWPHRSVHDDSADQDQTVRLPTEVSGPLLDRLMRITGVGPLLGRRPETLSGGERQRLALVRALATGLGAGLGTGLVLLDEPFTALEEDLRRELWALLRELLRELRRERGLSLLLATQDLAAAYVLAERVTVLIDGHAAQSGDTTAVYRRPASAAVARFLGLKNLFAARVAGPNSLYCPALGGRFSVTGLAAGYPVGVEVWLAIRAEQVSLRPPNEPLGTDETRLSGRFEGVLDLGEAALLQFRVSTGALLEVRCGRRLLSRYGVRTGAPGLVDLAARDLFVIPWAVADESPDEPNRGIPPIAPARARQQLRLVAPPMSGAR